ncbi:NAD-dependent deacylase [Brevibacillus sp. M2.1A]|uniref:NAD-dependent deacylase n=1 Tax=Brevibacillus TaxID=55080 RepID=UPI00156B3206|nr:MULTISPECIES: NAD-dependent deacylase [Brevibacillus]MBY0088278.1 NAD-dependent deacylase [Brevibacillus brevis]MCC8435543.1 NAD-dependent deacylase [Brevibacillus sp. M2.1A]UKL01275.1 NAD-dependent deacylase [Brevibacillus brevis]
MDHLAYWLRTSSFTVVFTGAGMSTESGLPDFRSQSGLWRGKDPMQLASTRAMMENREAFVEFYQMRIQGLLSCKPHAGHEWLAEWERRGLVHGIITQNVDGFHQEAGSLAVAELHGSLAKIRCLACGTEYAHTRYLEDQGTICACGGFLRPGVVLFGESLPQSQVDQAISWTEQADLFIVLGSSLTVSPANWFPQHAKERGAKLVIVNQEPTPLDAWADEVIQKERIGDVLQRIGQSLGE